MKRRNRVLLMWMLTGIWLCVQSPWVHAQRMQSQAHAFEHAAAQVAAEPDPCHGAEEQPAPDSTGCCDGGHCDGQCANLSWALAAPVPQSTARAAAWLTPMQVVAMPGRRQPELFRPPI